MCDMVCRFEGGKEHGKCQNGYQLSSCGPGGSGTRFQTEFLAAEKLLFDYTSLSSSHVPAALKIHVHVLILLALFFADHPCQVLFWQRTLSYE